MITIIWHFPIIEIKGHHFSHWQNTFHDNLTGLLSPRFILRHVHPQPKHHHPKYSKSTTRFPPALDANFPKHTYDVAACDCHSRKQCWQSTILSDAMIWWPLYMLLLGVMLITHIIKIISYSRVRQVEFLKPMRETRGHFQSSIH